jgi:hypothetical protein
MGRARDLVVKTATHDEQRPDDKDQAAQLKPVIASR